MVVENHAMLKCTNGGFSSLCRALLSPSFWCFIKFRITPSCHPVKALKVTTTCDFCYCYCDLRQMSADDCTYHEFRINSHIHSIRRLCRRRWGRVHHSSVEIHHLHFQVSRIGTSSPGLVELGLTEELVARPDHADEIRLRSQYRQISTTSNILKNPRGHAPRGEKQSTIFMLVKLPNLVAISQAVRMIMGDRH